MLELLIGADVFAPAPLGRRQILIGGGRILWIGESLPALPATLGVRVRDLKGLRVIPGLIDGHAHITGGGGESGYASRVPEVGLSRFTTAGVTTVVGLLGTDDLTRTPGEVVARARALEEEGMSAWAWTGGYHFPAATITGSVRGDIVHIDKVVGAGELAISDHRSSQPSFDEFLRIASECHVAGLMTGKAGVLHLHLGDGARGLDFVRRALEQSELPARVFQPTHVNRNRRLFAEALEIARRGVHVDVTAYPRDDDDGGLDAVDALCAYFDAGVPADRITVSSDGGGCLPCFDEHGRVARMDVGDPSSLPQALAALLDRGLRLEQVLAPFTTNWASLLRLSRKGRIAVGADADLVVLDGSNRIADVLCLGRWHVQGGKPLIAGTFENRPPAPSNGADRSKEVQS